MPLSLNTFNKMKRIIVLILVSSLFNHYCFAQSVIIPSFKDKYSGFVQQLESGNTDIDYKAFRESLIDSEQFFALQSQSANLDKKKLKLRKLVLEEENYDEAIKLAATILSVDYTSIEPHYLLTRTFKATGDTINEQKHGKIMTSLVQSILDNGDGKTCATGWPVIKVEEEYFILRVLGLQPLAQSLVREGGVCDKLEVQTKEGGTLTYYFNVAKLFEGYDRKPAGK